MGLRKSAKDSILVEGGALLEGQFTGVARHTLGIVRAVSEELSVTIGLFASERVMAELSNLPIHKHSILPRKLWFNLRRHTSLPKLNYPGEAVIWYPNFTLFPEYKNHPTIVTIHDLVYLHYPETVTRRNLSYLQKFVPKAINSADHIITPSNATKQDILDNFSVSPEKVTVVYPSLLTQRNMVGEDTLLTKWGLQTYKYILFVGSNEPRKNLSNLLEAYSRLYGSDKTTPQLVLAGGAGWKSDRADELIEALRRQGCNIKTLGYITNEELSALYKNAASFVFPSLYEGFGMPVLEALSFGTPVVTSNTSSLPEAGGNLAIYVDPNNTSEIAEGITQALKSKRIQPSKVARHISRFSAASQAKAFMNAVDSLAR